jgi:hypothetical protein
LSAITIDYLTKPKKVNLSVVQRDLPTDTSASLEWPEHVIYEIANKIVELHLENAKDPRVQSFGSVNTTILPTNPLGGK